MSEGTPKLSPAEKDVLSGLGVADQAEELLVADEARANERAEAARIAEEKATIAAQDDLLERYAIINGTETKSKAIPVGEAEELIRSKNEDEVAPLVAPKNDSGLEPIDATEIRTEANSSPIIAPNEVAPVTLAESGAPNNIIGGKPGLEALARLYPLGRGALKSKTEVPAGAPEHFRDYPKDTDFTEIRPSTAENTAHVSGLVEAPIDATDIESLGISKQDIENLTAYGWSHSDAVDLLVARKEHPEAKAPELHNLLTAIASPNPVPALEAIPAERIITAVEQESIDSWNRAAELFQKEIVVPPQHNKWYTNYKEKFNALPKGKKALIAGAFFVLGTGFAAGAFTMGGILGMLGWGAGKAIAGVAANFGIKQIKALDGTHWAKRSARYGLATAATAATELIPGVSGPFKAWYGSGEQIPGAATGPTAPDANAATAGGLVNADGTAPAGKEALAQQPKMDEKVVENVQTADPSTPKGEFEKASPILGTPAHEVTSTIPEVGGDPFSHALFKELYIVQEGDNLWKIVGDRISGREEYIDTSPEGKEGVIATVRNYMQKLSPDKIRSLGFPTGDLATLKPGNILHLENLDWNALGKLIQHQLSIRP